MSELIGASVQLDIGQLPMLKDYGDVVGGTFDLLFEQLMDELVFRIDGRGIVESGNQLLSLRAAQNRQFADGSFRIPSALSISV